MESAIYGPYVLLEHLGSGGSGDAFLARSIDPARNIPAPIVLKRLHMPLVESEHFVQRFLHEAEIALTTDSPHVARIYDVGAAGGTFFMAIEHVSGWTLTSVLTAMVDARRQAPVPLVARLMTQALIGLDALHNARDDDGVPLEFIHRDLAPKNIMLGDDGIVRIIDLGLGKSRAQDWQTERGAMLGSVGYMSPEQINGRRLDRRTDLFSMAVVFYELLTVRRYIKFGPVMEMMQEAMNKRFVPPSKERPGIPPALDDVMAKALALNPRDRYGSAQEFLEALLRVVPPQTSYEEIRKFLYSLFGNKIIEQRRQIEKLLARPLPGRAVARQDSVILGSRLGVDPIGDLDGLTTVPSGLGFDDDSSDVPTFDNAKTRKLEAIPPGDTEPSGVIDPLQEVVRKAMMVRSRLSTTSSKRKQITETLAYLALARASEESGKISKIRSLRQRLEELTE